MKAQRIEYDLDNSEDKQAFDEWLNECHQCNCEMCNRFGYARMLETVEPTTYNCSFSDYIDGQPHRFECSECGEVFENMNSDEAKEEADHCCMFECPECFEWFETEEEAENHCKEEE